MKVIEWLNANAQGLVHDTLLKLEEEKGITHSFNPDYPKLVVLNYDQIESPKFDPIVRECRSLVLEYDNGWHVISRSFDRFFNYGEEPVGWNIQDLVAYEKMDGSLISVFFYNGEWLYRTRKMLMPVSNIHDSSLNVTWNNFIEEALGEKWLDFCEENSRVLNHVFHSHTFIFEVVGPENRVVVRYPDRKAALLAIRHNSSGGYARRQVVLPDSVAKDYGWIVPREYTFATMSQCLESAKELRNLEEGYVLYGTDQAPAFKMKNPAYVAAHHLRGEGVLTPRRVMDLLIINEIDEYLSIFPEDMEKMMPYIYAYQLMWEDIEYVWGQSKHIEDQKEFAKFVSDFNCMHMMFRLRQGQDAREVFDKMTRQAKYRLIESYKVTE